MIKASVMIGNKDIEDKIEVILDSELLNNFCFVDLHFGEIISIPHIEDMVKPNA